MVSLESLKASYEQVPYLSNAFKWCAPGYLRAVAHLYGVELPKVATARILEVGCAAGGNCIPAAFLYPEATVVGVDISASAIAQGQAVIDRAGLRNIRLHAQCLTQITPEWGQFDYIILHGVFSWVPPALQQAIFQLCQQHLSPQGVAYISYNTYPGWKAQEYLREMMLWHSEKGLCTQARLNQAKELLPLLADQLAKTNPLREVLEPLAAAIPTDDLNDYYLAHEYLELHNHPIYVSEFAKQAQQCGLRLIGDADAKEEVLRYHGLDENQAFLKLWQQKEGIDQQQLLDFTVGRSFRKSLLMFSEAVNEAAHFSEAPNLGALEELLFAANSDIATQKYSKAVQIIGRHLGKNWPRPLSGRDLKRFVRQSGHTESQAQQALEEVFLYLPIEICRSYEDLPSCLQDYHVGLVPGVAQVLLDRHHHQLTMSDFNAWYSSSIAHFSVAELFVVQCLQAGYSVGRAASALVAHLEEGCEEEALEWVEEMTARLRNYAMYV